MNSGKKALKGQGTNSKKKKEKKEPSTKRTKIIVGIAAVLIVILSVFIGYEQLHRPLILKVNDKRIYLDDLMYLIHASEVEGNMYSQYFGAGDGYWNMDYGDGKTVGDAVKEEIISQATQNEVLFSEAMKADYKLTEEEEKKTETTVDNLLSQSTDAQKKKAGFTKDNLMAVLNHIAIAEKYKKDLIDGFDIDDEAIKAGVDYDEYRQYDVQFYKIATTKTDEENKSVAMTDAEKKEAYNKLSALYETAKTAEDFAKLIDEEDKENPIKFTAASNFTATGDWALGDEAKEQVMKLKNNEISNIIETEDGYYFVKMVNDNSSQSYDNAVKAAINEEETKRFDEEYAKILKNYNVTVYDKEWKKVKLGTVTM